MKRVFYPEFLRGWKEITRASLFNDAGAGLVVGVVAFPLAISFAIASGVTPEKGILTAILGGFIVSWLGGSKVQIGGPTGAFIALVYSIVAQHGLDGLVIATLMAGAMQILLGVSRIGEIIRLMPYPVITGFTSGIAVVIFITQIRDILGLPGKLPGHSIEQIQFYAAHIGSTNFFAILISCTTAGVIMLWSRYFRRIPGAIIALAAATLAAVLFRLPVETIGSRFGEIQNVLPTLHLPDFTLEKLRQLTGPAIAISLLGSIEALLSASVADGMTGSRHHASTELVANGIANLIVPLFGGIPVTGAIARTATNIRNGAQTPLAGIVHSIVLLLIFIFFLPFASLFPIAALAGILIVVCYHMSEWRSFLSVLKTTRSDSFVLLATFLLTVLVDLTVAIEAGIMISILSLLRRLTMAVNVDVHSLEEDDPGNGSDALKLPDQVEVFEINGPFFFGIAHKFEEASRIIRREKPRVRILRLRMVPFMDATALHYLDEFLRKSRQEGIKVIFSGVNEQPMQALLKSGLSEKIGVKNIFREYPEAAEAARRLAAG